MFKNLPIYLYYMVSVFKGLRRGRGANVLDTIMESLINMLAPNALRH